MEDRYDVPMTFDESLIPVHVTPIAAGRRDQVMRVWCVSVWCCLGPQEGGGRPSSLMADMFGFTSEEEMSDTKAYLHNHGNYQLEQVSVTE